MKKKIHLIRKDNSRLTICGVAIYENDANHVTKSVLNVTCGNCKTMIEMIDEDIMVEREKELKRYQLGHNRNQTNLEDMF